METCEICGVKLSKEKQRRRAKYCSANCHKDFERIKLLKLNPKINICTGSVGAINELKVAIDLMEKGAYVFRALSPNSSCDLLVIYKDKYFRLEVTTGYYRCDGNKFTYPRHDASKYDLLAVVLHDKIYYEPPLEKMFES